MLSLWVVHTSSFCFLTLLPSALPWHFGQGAQLKHTCSGCVGKGVKTDLDSKKQHKALCYRDAFELCRSLNFLYNLGSTHMGDWELTVFCFSALQWFLL